MAGYFIEYSIFEISKHYVELAKYLKFSIACAYEIPCTFVSVKKFQYIFLKFLMEI